MADVKLQIKVKDTKMQMADVETTKMAAKKLQQMATEVENNTPTREMQMAASKPLQKTADKQLHLDDAYITEVQLRVAAYKDINRLYETTEGLTTDQVEALKEWLRTQPHLPETSELMLILFLNACNFDLKKTKRCIEQYYSARSTFTAALSGRDPKLPLNQTVMNAVLIEPMKQLTPEGYIVFYSKLLDPALEKFDYPTHIKLFDMRLHLALREHGCLKGFVCIADMQQSTLKHMYKCGYFNVKKGMDYFQNGLPIQIRGAHYVNPTSFMDFCFQVIYPMISEELRQMLHVHKEHKSIFEHLPKECVPNELGGTGGSVEEMHANFIKVLNENADYFIEDEELVADDSKRESKSFRKKYFW